MDELIRKQDALDAIHCDITVTGRQNAELVAATIGAFADRIKALPPVQPNHNADPGKMEIVRCKDCKHWNLQVGNVKGDGLGSCDFHNVNLVTGEGFCYWADRRGESE